MIEPVQSVDPPEPGPAARDAALLGEIMIALAGTDYWDMRKKAHAWFDGRTTDPFADPFSNVIAAAVNTKRAILALGEASPAGALSTVLVLLETVLEDELVRLDRAAVVSGEEVVG